MNIRTIPMCAKMCDMMLVRHIITLCIALTELIQQDQDRAISALRSINGVLETETSLLLSSRIGE